MCACAQGLSVNFCGEKKETRTHGQVTGSRCLHLPVVRTRGFEFTDTPVPMVCTRVFEFTATW